MALSSYTDLFDGVVQSVGGEVRHTGTNLVSTAGIVAGTDASNAWSVSTGGDLLRGIDARTEVSV